MPAIKHLLAVPVWAAGPEMIEWLLRGIAENLEPDRVQIVFYFDGNRADSLAAFDGLAGAILAGFVWHRFGSDQEIRDPGCHDWFIDYFVQNTDAGTLIVSQDDIRFQTSFVPHLDRVLAELVERVGYIGMREGFGLGYAGMIASPFDAPYAGPGKVRELAPGSWETCLMVNPGPLVYPRSTVAKVGKLDRAYRDWHWWCDYALRAHQAGLVNVILSIDALHKKFGGVRAGVVAADAEGWEPKDRALLNQKWSPQFGRIV